MQRCLAKGVTASLCQPLQQHRQNRGREGRKGGVFPKSGLYSLIGEPPKKPQALTKPIPSGRVPCPVPGLPRSRRPRSRRRVPGNASQEREDQGRAPVREGRDSARCLQANSLHKGKLTETPGFVVFFVCLFALQINIYLGKFAHVFPQN